MTLIKPPIRLLVLDDDAEVGRTMTAIAMASGFDSQATSNAADFFNILQTWSPTHIALDLVMPDIDGIEVLRQLGQAGCKAQIIITSGIGEQVLKAAYRSAAEHGLGVVGTLSKPFSPDQLRSLLAKTTTATAELADRPSDEIEAAMTLPSFLGALEERHITVWYQPKFHCQSGQLAGFEALARWHHPQLGLISPDRFIPFAEAAGLIDILTDYVYDQALRWFTTHFLHTSLLLSLNISASSLSDIRLTDRIVSICQSYQIAPTRIILEMTETSAMADPVTTLDLLTRLRIKGMKLSIDDFGTGYSSLIRLARLPFSELKIDKMFVINAAQSSESQNIIKAIIGLGHSLGLRITAEGVEDPEAFQFLRAAGCDLAQGFWLARPMAGDAALQCRDLSEPGS